MPKRISVDAALFNNQPVIQFRGVDYALRDLTVRERVERALRYREEWEEMEAEQAAAFQRAGAQGETPDEREWASQRQRMYARAVQEALVGVSDAVAASITEREFSVLQQAIQAARELVTPAPTAENVERDEVKGPGEAAVG